jgi:hypothetical protein
MTTNRTPIGRPPISRITPKAVATFRAMQKLEARCTCPPTTWDERYFEHKECKACEQWWVLNKVLVDELRLMPWEWPAYEKPDTESPYPEGSHARKDNKPDLEGQARYRALERAAAEAAQ